LGLALALCLTGLPGAAGQDVAAQGEAAQTPAGQAAPSAGAEAIVELNAQSAPSTAAPEQSPPSASYGEYPATDRYAAPPVESDAASLEGVPGAREHEGLFVRLQVGPGAARTQYKEQVDGAKLAKVEATGLSGSFDLSVGGRVVGNLILHGNLTYERFRSEYRYVNGVKDAALKVSTTMLNLGAGVTYYFMPYNVFLSTAVGPAWLFERRPAGEVRSNTGFFLLAAAGKEWWVGPRGQWAMGASLRFTFAAAAVDIGGTANTLRFANLSLALSTTFN
jgi:hypothetical protein